MVSRVKTAPHSPVARASVPSAAPNAKPSTPVKGVVPRKDEFTQRASNPLLDPKPSQPTISTGSSAALNVQDLVKADAQRVASATQQSPRAGAEMLASLLKANPSATYRKALSAAAAGSVTEMGKAVSRSTPSKQDMAATLKSLSEATALSSPDGHLGAAFSKELSAATIATFGGDSKSVPIGPVSLSVAESILTGTPGAVELLQGMIDQATAAKNPLMAAELQRTLMFTTTAAVENFDAKQKRFLEVNDQLATLVQGFGKGADPKKVERAISEFRKSHAKDFDDFEKAGAALAPMLESAKSLLTDKALAPEIKLSLVKVLERAPAIGDTVAGQEAIDRAVEHQAKGEPSFLDGLPDIAKHVDDSEGFSAKMATLITQSVGARATQLVAAGKLSEAQKLIGGLSKNAKLFGVAPSKMVSIQSSLQEVVAGKPEGLGDLKDALAEGLDGASEFFKGRTANTLKGLSLVLGVAALPGKFKNIGDAELGERIRAMSETLDLTQEAGSYAIQMLGKGKQMKALDSLFGKVGKGANVVIAAVDIVQSLTALGEGRFETAATSGLDATSGILLMIPGMQVAGVAFALASMVLGKVFDEQHERRVQKGIEKDAKNFLINEGLKPDLAAALSNVNGQHQNIGPLLEEVAAKLKLTPQQLFEKMNAVSGSARTEMIKNFTGLAAVSDLTDEVDYLYGPKPTREMLKPVEKLIGAREAEKLLQKVLQKRDDTAGLLAQYLRTKAFAK